MAIQSRRGNSADFDANKLLSGEFVTVIDQGKPKICITPGNVKTLATVEDMSVAISEANQIIIDELTLGANAAANIVEGVLDGVNRIIDNNGTFYQMESENGSLYLKEIAPDPTSPLSTTILDDINSLQMNVSDLESRKIDKTNIVNTDQVNDSTKVVSAAVAYNLGQEIDTINSTLSFIGDQEMTATFGSNVTNGRYWSSFIFIPGCNRYNITFKGAVVQNVKIIDVSTLIIGWANKLGFMFSCSDSAVAGNTLDFTINLSLK
jgi:hypothetical protein